MGTPADVPASQRYALMVEPAELRQARFGALARWIRSKRRTTDDGMLIFYVLDRDSGESFLRHIDPADDPHVFEAVERDLDALTVAEFEHRYR